LDFGLPRMMFEILNRLQQIPLWGEGDSLGDSEFFSYLCGLEKQFFETRFNKHRGKCLLFNN